MTVVPTATVNDSASVRDYLIEALRLDLIGPRTGDEALQHERLPYAPSRWYLTGFLGADRGAGRATGAGRRGRTRRAVRADTGRRRRKYTRTPAAANASFCPRPWV